MNKGRKQPAAKCKPVSKPKEGRPSLYKREYNDQVYKLCLLGAVDAEIAEFFQIDERTLNRWKKDYPEFCQSMSRGKTLADANVAESLYKRATGCTIEEKQYEEAKLKRVIKKELAPDTAAASRWLGNRRRKFWGDKLEVNNFNTNINSVPLTPDEVKDISKELENEY